MKYDILVIGSGPGGYVAAIRSAQLGLKTAIVEKSELGGICLNWGCIPTKALLKCAQVYKDAAQAGNYGVDIETQPVANLEKMVNRSRDVSSTMSKGVKFLLDKNKIDIYEGFAKLKTNSSVEVKLNTGETTTIEAENIIIATGARSRELPNLKQDGKKIIGYREALVLKEKPESMVVVGSGAIGSEFAYFFSTIGVKVTLVEFMPQIVPTEDEEIARILERNFKRSKIKVMTSATVESVDINENNKCNVTIKTAKGNEQVECDIVLSAVGISANIENIGLEELGIKVEKGRIIVDKNYKTNVEGIYAIGDVIPGPALAHISSAEALACVNYIAKQEVNPVNYNNIPGCIYTIPEVSSTGLSEKKAIEQGYSVRVGKFPFTASGKATAVGVRDGMVKVVIDEKTDKLLGAHLVGYNVTELIAEMVLAIENNLTAHDIVKAVHPHPTINEGIVEAIENAYNKAIHL